MAHEESTMNECGKAVGDIPSRTTNYELMEKRPTSRRNEAPFTQLYAILSPYHHQRLSQRTQTQPHIGEREAGANKERRQRPLVPIARDGEMEGKNRQL
jgi:hypothetical protein